MDKEVQNYIDSIEDDKRRKDVHELANIISNVGSHTPKMWGKSIISFGLYHYKYDSGREGEAPVVGISNRKNAIVIYGLQIAGEDKENNQLLAQLGKHKTGKGCLYISSLADIDLPTLKKMIRNANNK
ncbi:MAG: DUF1801 domain-containing protein [Mycobacteriaceae bacterium]